MTEHGIELREASTAPDLARCFRLVRELRPHLDEASFAARIADQRESGYHLLVAWSGDEPVGAAGYRFGTNLAWGRYCYVDDLVVRSTSRSRGIGRLLLDAVREAAQAVNCDELHLDSGRSRTDAHRFYERAGLDAASLHFKQRLRSE